MSFESYNYVVITQQALLFPPLTHLFRNHYCLCTTGADAQQELCCLGKPLTLGFLCHHPLSDPLGDTHGQGEDLFNPPWGLLPPVTYCAWQSLSDCRDLAPETVWCWTQGDPDMALWLPVSPPTLVTVSLLACLQVFCGT